MARLVDVIEAMIKDMIDENDGQATINRSILAEQANCVPSQITYVLSTRFSVGAMSSKEGAAIMAAVSDRSLAKVDSDIRSVVRADIFKNALLGLMIT